ncbi:MAG: hypothetical protein WB507_10075 [Solirubrobacterales bacterium]
MSGTSAALALASSWTVRQLSDGPTEANIFGISCPSASLCVAVGSNSTVATSTNPIGGASAWNAVHPEGYVEGGPGPGKTLVLGKAIRGVSCPSVNLCVAVVSNPRHVLTSTEPTGGASAWHITELPPQALQMEGISCPSAHLCVAVTSKGNVVTSTDPTGGASDWTTAEVGEGSGLRGVACPNESLCVAVGPPGKVFVSTDPAGGTAAWSMVSVAAGLENLYGVSCSTSSLCVAAGFGGIISSTNPAANPSSWHATTVGLSVQDTGVFCNSSAGCAVTDNNGDVITAINPSGGSGAWTLTNAISALPNFLSAISCPSASLCAGVGSSDQIITSSEPFSAEGRAVRPPEGHPSGRHSKPPKVRIIGHPPRRVTRMGGAKVHFRFRAIGKANGFLCALDRARFSRCRSPKSYEAVPGRHVFRVKAVGPGGVSRVPAVARYTDRCRVFCGMFAPTAFSSLLSSPFKGARYL